MRTSRAFDLDCMRHWGERLAEGSVAGEETITAEKLVYEEQLIDRRGILLPSTAWVRFGEGLLATQHYNRECFFHYMKTQIKNDCVPIGRSIFFEDKKDAVEVYLRFAA